MNRGNEGEATTSKNTTRDENKSTTTPRIGDVDCLVMGEILMEFVAIDKNVPLDQVKHWETAAGGAPANVAVAIERLGQLHSKFVGCVGDDPFGKSLRHTLEQNNVDVSSFTTTTAAAETGCSSLRGETTTALTSNTCNITLSGDENNEPTRTKATTPTMPKTTTRVFTAVYDDGHKELHFDRGADSFLTFSRSDMVVVKKAKFHNDDNTNVAAAVPSVIVPPLTTTMIRCFHYGSISLIDVPGSQHQREAMELAKSLHTIMMTYDPNYRPTLWNSIQEAHTVIVDAMKYAHMVKLSREEFEVVTGYDPNQNLIEGIEYVLDQGVDLVVVTKDEDGAMAVTKDGIVVESPAASNLQIVETTGAGDAFMAAMITKLLPVFEAQNNSLAHVSEPILHDALEYANIVAGLTCETMGAIPALPTCQQVDEFLLQKHKQITTKSPPVDAKTLASMIDHTFLKPYVISRRESSKLNNADDKVNDVDDAVVVDVEDHDLKQLCEEAIKYGFAMVAVNPASVQKCCHYLSTLATNRSGSRIPRVGAAIGFPLGQTTSETKVFEIRDSLLKGATEIDMVINVREFQCGNYDLILQEITTMVDLCNEFSATFNQHITSKVILETCYLSKQEIIKACQLCQQVKGLDFVKTSTGFGTDGATVENVKLMRQTIIGYDDEDDNKSAPCRLQIKASGGIRDLKTALEMIDAGATRIGTSCGVQIMEEYYTLYGKDG